MISKELETYRALAAKRGHDGLDASKALLALPVLLAEMNELRALLVEMAEIAEDGLSSTPWVSPDRSGDLNELKARAGL